MPELDADVCDACPFAGCGCDYQGGTDNTTNLIRRNRESTP